MGVFEHFPYTNFHDMNDAWILKVVKECAEAVESMEEWKAQHQQEYEELKQFMDDIEAGNFPQSMYDAMISWLESNALEIVGNMVKFISVGINNNGYITITIPEHWKDLIFKTTGYDYNTPLQPEYGHLCLLY